MTELPLRLMVDACVLFPRIPRGLVLNAAEAGLIFPLWSPRILEEWRRSALKRGGRDADVGAIIAAMNTRWPEASVPPDPGIEDVIRLPDGADAHVVAAAAGNAPAILTFNMRDFPRRVLAGHGLVARHPDEVFWYLFSVAPAPFGALVRALTTEQGAHGPDATRKLLKRALLPRLGKAVAAEWERISPA